MSRGALVLGAVLAIAGIARADGGAVRLKQTAGPFAVTVFTPEPLRAGPTDISVLVQSAPGGATILDAGVELTLTPPEGDAPIHAAATRELSTNKLLVAAIVDLDRPGTWNLRADIRRGDERARVEGEIEVGAAPPRWQSLWFYLALPFAVVGLFVVGQLLKRRRP